MRRNLSTPASKDVVPLWKQMANSELEKRERQADLVSGFGDPAQVSYMGRRCLYAYVKVLNAQAVVESRISKDVDVIVHIQETYLIFHKSQGSNNEDN